MTTAQHSESGNLLSSDNASDEEEIRYVNDDDHNITGIEPFLR